MLGAVRVFEDCRQGPAREAPPLAPQMWHEARGDRAAEADPALGAHIQVKKPAMLAPGEGEAEREAFLCQAADGPGHIGGGDTLDEVRMGTRVEVFDQFRHRAERQAGTGGEVDVAHVRMPGQKLGRGRLRGGDKRPCSPVTGIAAREADDVEVRQSSDEIAVLRRVGPPVHMDHDRTALCGPEARHLGRTIERGVAKHHETERRGHAQFPLDMRPRISSWRQLMYFSDHLHQRSPSSFRLSA